MLAFGLAFPAVLALAYALPWFVARRRGVRWAWPRVLAAASAVVVLVVALLGTTTALRAQHDWVMALALALVAVIVPFLYALGDPIRLLCAATGRPLGARTREVLAVALFPLFGSIVNAVVLIGLFTFGFRNAQTSTAGWVTATLVGFAAGLFVNLPLLTDELLPAWITPGWKMLFGGVDGILDEVPGVVVMTTVNGVAGGTLLVVTQFVALPMVGALLYEWVRHDMHQARAVDAELDAARDEAGTADDELDRPWWEA